MNKRSIKKSAHIVILCFVLLIASSKQNKVIVAYQRITSNYEVVTEVNPFREDFGVQIDFNNNDEIFDPYDDIADYQGDEMQHGIKFVEIPDRSEVSKETSYTPGHKNVKKTY